MGQMWHELYIIGYHTQTISKSSRRTISDVNALGQFFAGKLSLSSDFVTEIPTPTVNVKFREYNYPEFVLY